MAGGDGTARREGPRGRCSPKPKPNGLTREGPRRGPPLDNGPAQCPPLASVTRARASHCSTPTRRCPPWTHSAAANRLPPPRRPQFPNLSEFASVARGRRLGLSLWTSTPLFLHQGPPPDAAELPSNCCGLHSNRRRLPSNRRWLPSNCRRLPSNRRWLPSNCRRLPSNCRQLPSNRRRLPSNRHRHPPTVELRPMDASSGFLPDPRDRPGCRASTAHAHPRTTASRPRRTRSTHGW